jgi:hypothetical protein
LTLASPLALAQATYTHVAPAYDNVVAPYTTASRITGNFRVTGVLAANLLNADISAQLQSYSFTDGQATRTQATSTICQFTVSTNAAGQIIANDIWLRELAPGASSHSLELRAPDSTNISGFATPAVTGCGAVGLDPFGSVLTPVTPPVWTLTGLPTQSIQLPTLSTWSLALLGGTMAFGSLLLLRRR